MLLNVQYNTKRRGDSLESSNITIKKKTANTHCNINGADRYRCVTQELGYKVGVRINSYLRKVNYDESSLEYLK